MESREPISGQLRLFGRIHPIDHRLNIVAGFQYEFQILSLHESSWPILMKLSLTPCSFVSFE